MSDYLGICACSRRMTLLSASRSGAARDLVEHRIQWRVETAHRNRHYWRRASTLMALTVRSTHCQKETSIMGDSPIKNIVGAQGT